MGSFLFALMVLYSTGAAAAAQGQAAIRGIVTDETGAVVRDALVTVTAQGVGPERSTRTDERGMFEVASLPPGLYVLRVERAGFATLTRSNVEAAPAPPMLELRLETGGVTESVTVLATRSRLATKAETPILQTPQAISVVPEALLDEQGTASLGEALRNVSGAALSGNWRGTYEIYAQRGFYSDSDGNFRRNGIEISKFTSILSPNTERVEVLKGPASVLYGRIDPGGVINVVTKRPEARRSSEAEIRAGSFGTIDGRFDTTGPLTENSKVLYRFNANWDRRDSYRDVVSGDSFFVSPVVTMLLGSRTKWDVDYEHRREENTVDVGIAAPANTFEALDRMPIETFLGEEDARATLSYNNVLSTFEHQLGNTWTFRNVVSLIDYDRAPHDVTLGALAANRRTIARTADFREQDYRSTVAEVNFLGSISTGRIRHKIAVGANYHRTVLDQQQFRSAIAPIDIFEPVYSGLPSVLPTVADSRQQVDMAGVFAQDQIELTSQFHVQTGVRLSTFEQKTLNRLTSVTQPIDVEDVSPQVGFAWLPKSWMSLYASYSESFAPNLAISADGRSFDPKTANQYEVGFKADALDGRLTSTFAAFRLTYEGNLSFVRNPVTGVFDTLQGGVQRSTGIELDVSARPAAGWTVVGSYGWLNARVITDPAYLPGRRLGGAPEHRANVWVSWESPWRVGFGGGVFYQAEFKEFTSSDFFLPGFTTADAMASYRVSPRIRARVNIKNLFNERYYLSGAGGFVAYPAPPRHALASLVVSF